MPWGRESSLVGRLDFKSSKGRKPVLGGFDSHSLPPSVVRTEIRQALSQDYLNALQKVALGCEEEERRFRREAERRIAALAEARTHAYPPSNALKPMVEPASPQAQCKAPAPAATLPAGGRFLT